MTDFSICICNSSAVNPNHWTKNVKESAKNKTQDIVSLIAT